MFRPQKFSRRHESRLNLLVPLLACLLLSPSTPLQAAQPMNFVFLLVDDLGWADLSCYGSSFYETPHLDALAAEGMKFTNGYAACPVCSPTRASILTGRHPVRVDITDYLPGMPLDRYPGQPRFHQVEDRDHLALEEVTIAEALKPADYRSCFVGKWHLGEEGHWPTEQGFDLNIGGNSKGSPPGGYYSPWKNPTLQARHDGEYLTERLTEESIKFLTQQTQEQPFLLYLAYYNVHSPITPYKKRVEHFRSKARQQFDSPTPVLQEHNTPSRGRQDNPDYASMVAAVDMSIGEILKTLKTQGLDENTAVFFFSDNGGLCTLPRLGPTSNLPLRSGKGWLYEGGVREPMIVRVPGVTTAGSVCDTPVISMDFFPTMLELAGLPQKPELHVDGQSLLPLLQGKSADNERTLYWHYPHYHGSNWTPGASIRQGDWKLIQFYHWDKTELYNLKQDPGEQHDLSQQHPEKTAALKHALEKWQQDMQAKMPVPIQ